MSSTEYNQLLKFLYFEGYADSYEEAENLLEDMSDEEFKEIQEAWYSGQSGYRTTASGQRRMRDEPDESEQLRQSDEIARNPRVRAERNAAARATLKAKGKVPQRVNPNTGEKTPVFESVVEYLFVKGYADTIENAEVMAESISEDWVNEILVENQVNAMNPKRRQSSGGFNVE